LTLEEIEKEINGYYKWFAENAGSVVVQEAGDLADLWALFDRGVRNAAKSMSPEEILYEFGYNYG